MLQQVQIWNSGYAFAYSGWRRMNAPAKWTIAGIRRPNDYENHVVGFWGDFVVYVTSNSNLGTTRYGDYTTIRTLHGIDGASPFFDAFGYGLNTGKIPQTDVRYVQFGRNSCDARKAANPVPQKGTTNQGRDGALSIESNRPQENAWFHGKHRKLPRGMRSSFEWPTAISIAISVGSAGLNSRSNLAEPTSFFAA